MKTARVADIASLIPDGATLMISGFMGAGTPSRERVMETMQHKPILTQQEVARVLDAARTEAQKKQWAVAIAIVDDGGHPLALERLDRCAPVGAYVAIEKARTAALGRRESKSYEEMINAGRTAFLSAPMSALLEGGVSVSPGHT